MDGAEEVESILVRDLEGAGDWFWDREASGLEDGGLNRGSVFLVDDVRERPFQDVSP